jgi:hypothetical protein
MSVPSLSNSSATGFTASAAEATELAALNAAVVEPGVVVGYAAALRNRKPVETQREKVAPPVRRFDIVEPGRPIWTQEPLLPLGIAHVLQAGGRLREAIDKVILKGKGGFIVVADPESMKGFIDEYSDTEIAATADEIATEAKNEGAILVDPFLVQIWGNKAFIKSSADGPTKYGFTGTKHRAGALLTDRNPGKIFAIALSEETPEQVTVLYRSPGTEPVRDLVKYRLPTVQQLFDSSDREAAKFNKLATDLAKLPEVLSQQAKGGKPIESDRFAAAVAIGISAMQILPPLRRELVLLGASADATSTEVARDEQKAVKALEHLVAVAARGVDPEDALQQLLLTPARALDETAVFEILGWDMTPDIGPTDQLTLAFQNASPQALGPERRPLTVGTIGDLFP